MYVNYICHACISDKYLAAEVESSGVRNSCLSCGNNTENCWTVEDLSARVKDAFDNNYLLTASEPELWEQASMRDPESNFEWYREGEPIISIIEELTGLPNHVCEELIEPWSGGPFWAVENGGDEDRYGADAHYEISGASSEAIEARWAEIQHELLHRSRFFSRSTHEFLDWLFEDVQGLHSFSGPVIEVKDPTSFDGLYRARVAYNDADVRAILEGLPGQLGVLRGRSVSAGRMNAAGVTVMYGAFDSATCIAEVRAPVGSRVVIGKFNLLRPIRVLNLKRLERCYEPPSIFDPEYQKKVDRLAFLRSLSNRLSAPVFGHSAHLEYLATQCIAEYIAALDPAIDGVAFSSSQAGGEAMNLVLFDDACHVKSLDPSLGKASFNDWPESDYDQFAGPQLFFNEPQAQATQQVAVIHPVVVDDDDLFKEVPRTHKQQEPVLTPTLELDLYSIKIHKIEAVNYVFRSSDVKVSHP